MYIARLTAGETQLVQGGVQLAYPRIGPGAIAGYNANDYWLDSLRALARGATSAAPISLSLRVRLDTRGRLYSCIGALAEATSEDALRRWLAGYTRLERVAADSSALPADRDAFDALFAEPDEGKGAWRVARTSAPDYRRNDLWVACDFQIFAILGELLLEARQLGHPVIAQVNLTSFSAPPDHVREARRNVVRLRDSGRAPDALLDLQEQLAQQLASAEYVVEELVGSTEGAVDTWLRPALERRFAEQFARLRFDPPIHVFRAWDNVRGLDPPLHSSLLDPDGASVADLCSTAADAGAMERVLGWVPPDALRFDPEASEPDEPVVAPNVLPPGLPPAGGRDGSFVFISYSHSDAPRIAPHLHALNKAAVPFWYDAGIPSGSEWDSVIESRIEKCNALVVFVSPRAVASKYVRREVKFADALDKPLVSVVLEPSALREGLRMLLTQYQMIDASVADLPLAVRQALSQRERPHSGPTT
jgi:hypothetical protein